ncbi:MAG TPA: hypothetical protein VFF11_10070 [Candidatus Binatia bacterium]|nr:hypothetical protein [Candidatus Binatia bacterium]
MLDGELIMVPAGRCSLNAIRSLLETRALEKQRVLSVISVDGWPADLTQTFPEDLRYTLVEAESIPLDELPLLLLNTAQQQVDRARDAVEKAMTLVLINNAATARELWWNHAHLLKDPVLTLSLMPDYVCRLCSNMSFEQLRKWQLEQIAAIIREVDQACDTGDNIQISDALEGRVLPWLQKLADLVRLWYQAVSAGYELGIKYSNA